MTYLTDANCVQIAVKFQEPLAYPAAGEGAEQKSPCRRQSGSKVTCCRSSLQGLHFSAHVFYIGIVIVVLL